MSTGDGAVPVPASDSSACSGCGHTRRAHQHYRRGTDCSLCSCPRFHRSPRTVVEGVVGGLARRFRRSSP
ncbi:hypothetical protein SAMN05660464_2157 [Geodermatophilus dictyosporus]|uniref:Uncharacterized protein n=1 Tax=Geodermatophilus dictyosporus TaxID=1523247 RepID=A0A1I5MUF7_9ACTN|nr:hypothetical protein SAMN05660464_2157 [Geodermatophilus dictyosporus]